MMPCPQRSRHAPVLLLLIGLSGCAQESSSPAAPSSGDSSHQSSAEKDVTSPAGDGSTATVAQVPEAPVTHSLRPRQSFRPADTRPTHDSHRLEESGIQEYRSRRLVLYTDIEPETAALLPPLLDRAFEAWEDYFGPLPPARDGSDYQLTGYLMRDQDRFRKAGLLPVTLPGFAHGRHDAQQFWMNDSEYDYYRRHLMIHEATHCFMQSMGGTTRDVPVWYLEGMAELFATHATDENGIVTFRVLPKLRENYVGFGRIPMIQRAVAEGRLLSTDDIGGLQPGDFAQNNESYAWAWALCTFADGHPRYRDLLRTLSRQYVDEGFYETYVRTFEPVIADFAAEWELFARHLCYGFDIERAAIEFVPASPASSNRDVPPVTVSANRGWQSSRLAVREYETYELTATGRTALAQLPQPWDSEPQGISIRYSEGRPIGRLLGLVISDPDSEADRRRLSDVIDIGRDTQFTAPFDGTLYLRVNDFWSELEDNTGEYVVKAGVNKGDN